MKIYPDTQELLTLKTVVGSDRISKFSETSYMFSLPAILKGLDEKKKTSKNWDTVFPHYKPKGAICCQQDSEK